MTIVSHREWTYEKPLVLVGFPSHGLVGAVAASYLVPALDMEMVATLDSEHLPPVASIRGGRAVSPIQFYASTRQCGLDGACSQLVVVRADAAPPPEDAVPIAREILTWCDSVGAEMVVTLEGAGGNVEDDKVYAVPNLVADVDVAALNAEPAGDGALTGMSAAILTQGNHRKMGAVCLYTAASGKHPDAAAAARLVQLADVLVPGIRMDPDPLQERALALEQALRANIDDQKASIKKMADEAGIMYR